MAAFESLDPPTRGDPITMSGAQLQVHDKPISPELRLVYDKLVQILQRHKRILMIPFSTHQLMDLLPR